MKGFGKSRKKCQACLTPGKRTVCPDCSRALERFRAVVGPGVRPDPEDLDSLIARHAARVAAEEGRSG